VRVRHYLYTAVAVLALIAGTSAQAQTTGSTTIGMDGVSHLAIGAGGFDLINGHKAAGAFHAEFRFGQQFFYLHPLLGAEVTTDGALFGYGGLGLDINLGPHWVLTPNAAVGAFDRGSGLKLGSVVEFRTGAELDYRFANDQRLGVAFHHISNGGLSKRNPGEEEMSLMYSLPISSLFAP